MRNLLFTLAALMATTPAMAVTTVFAESFDTARPQTYGIGETVGKFKIVAGDMDVVGDLNGTFFGCGGNNNCADTNGNHPVTLSALVDLVAGKTYRVSFDLAGNGPRDSNLYSLAAMLGDSTTAQFDTAPGTPFHTVSFDCVATSTSANEFRLQSLNSDQPGYWGPIIDNVKIEDLTVAAGVPEPTSWGLMIGGFGMIGAATRRRKSVVIA